MTIQQINMGYIKSFIYFRKRYTKIYIYIFLSSPDRLDRLLSSLTKRTPYKREYSVITFPAGRSLRFPLRSLLLEYACGKTNGLMWVFRIACGPKICFSFDNRHLVFTEGNRLMTDSRYTPAAYLARWKPCWARYVTAGDGGGYVGLFIYRYARLSKFESSGDSARRVADDSQVLDYHHTHPSSRQIQTRLDTNARCLAGVIAPPR